MLAQAKYDTAKKTLSEKAIPKRTISKKKENFYNSLSSSDWKANLTKLRNAEILSNTCKPQDHEEGQVFHGLDGSTWEYLGMGETALGIRAKTFRLIQSPVQ